VTGSTPPTLGALATTLERYVQAEEVAERLGGGFVTREVAESRAALAAVGG